MIPIIRSENVYPARVQSPLWYSSILDSKIVRKTFVRHLLNTPPAFQLPNPCVMIYYNPRGQKRECISIIGAVFSMVL